MNNITHIGTGEQVRMSSLLGQVAITVQVRTSCLGLDRIDKQTSRELNHDKNAIDDAGKAVVSRLAGADGDVKGIKKIHTETQGLLKSLSTPWNGRQLMPNINFELFLREFKLKEDQHAHAVATLVAKAPALIEKARYNLGAYNIQPPTLEEIRTGFSMEIIAEPIPDTSKYNASNLDRVMEEQLREQFEQNTQAAFAFAQKDVLQRVAKPLQNMVNACINYDEREAKKEKGEEVKGGYSRQTIVSNVQDIAHVFGSFNLFNDPEMAKLDDDLKVFFRYNYEDLKSDAFAREQMKNKAADILSKIDGYL